LRRRHFGSAKTLLDALALALNEEGVEAVVDDAEGWIPDQTGFGTDKDVTKAVKRAAQGFDVVHAWGYRAAWACSEAFYVRSPWLYTAYDMPKTVHSDLVDRLNAAHRGVCSSPSVKAELDRADALNLETIVPGVPTPDGPLPDREASRAKLGVREDALLVLALGRFDRDKGYPELVEAFRAVRRDSPETRLLVSGAGPFPPPLHQDGVEVRGPLSDVWEAYAAADLVVVPDRKCGFSLVAAEAMWAGVPVLLRNEAGLRDMAESGANAFYFDDDQDLAEQIKAALDMAMTRETVARSGRIRAESRFKFGRFVRDMAHVYKELGGP